VDIFPFLKHIPAWVPGAGFQRKAVYWKKTLGRLAEEPYQYVRRHLDHDVNILLFCGSILKEGIPAEEAEEDIKWTATAMYIGSADTTISTVSHFLLAMLENSHVLEKLQQEIDTVVGRERLPDFYDRPNLPGAGLSETWQWGVPVPINLPHHVTEDNIYRGMCIPRGSVVLLLIIVVRAILRDESVFPNTSKFQPECFLKYTNPQAVQKMNPRNYVIGFGRRRCPGADLIDSSIWLLLVTMVATLEISKPLDTSGTIIELKVEYNNTKFR
ncbi:cytochrome P450, partial [Mycena sp. CBHHK59/15]